MMQAKVKAWPASFYYAIIAWETLIVLMCVGVIARIYRKRRKGGRATEAGMLRFIDDLVLCLCWYYILEAVIQGYIMVPAFFAPKSSPYYKLYYTYWWVVVVVEGWFPQFFHTYIAGICYNWLVRGHSIHRLQASLKPALRLMALAVLFQTFFEVIVIFIDKWIPFYTPEKWAFFASYEHLAVFLLSTGLMSFFYMATCWTVMQRFWSRERVKKRHRKIVRRFMLINGLAIFAFSCRAAFVYMVYQDIDPTVHWGFILSIASLMQPVFDCLILGNLFKGVKCCSLKRLCTRQSHAAAAAGHRPGSAIPDPPKFPRQAGNHLSSIKYLKSFVGREVSSAGGGSHTGNVPASLFVTTFNMGPIKDLAGLGGRLEEWVPAGYDLYAIGVQECHCVEEVRAALHEYLGGPVAYHLFAAEVGPSTMLFGSISLTVLARASDVASGAFAAVGAETSRVRNGVNLVVTKASNKGMAGLSFRFHDATLAFITCHFASDSGGKKRLRQRNEDARRTLREVRLTDDEGFDVHLQHHHTFVCGDMNYRLRLPARAVVDRVAETARRLEASVWQDGDVAALDSAVAAAAATAGNEEAGDEEAASKDGGSWTMVPAEDSNGPPSEDDEDENAVEVAPLGTGDATSDEGPSWVSKAYMKLFTRGGDEALSFLSSYVGGGASYLTQANMTVNEDDEETSDELMDSRGIEWQSRDTSRQTEESGEGQQAPLDHDSVFAPTHETSALPPSRFRRWLSQHFRAFSPPGGEDKSSLHATSDMFSSFSSSSDAYLMYSSQPTAASVWNWVPEHDELKLEMRAGQVFAGFLEGPLAFPPPFRWRRGGNGGNFTNEERLAGAYVLMKKGDGERVPSYTDRVLYHSLPDVQHQLQLVTYQMCDHVRGSDHRPVSAAFQLTVNRSRVGFHTLPAGITTQDVVVAPERPIEYSAASTWSVHFFQPQYKPFRFRPSLALAGPSVASTSTAGSGRSTPSAAPGVPPMPQAHTHVSFYFPCLLEDPFAQDAKAFDLEAALVDRPEAMELGDDPQSRSTRNLDHLQRGHETTWGKLSSPLGLTFDVLVLPEVSRHALIRFTDGKTGTEIGQGVICLRQAFFAAPSPSLARDGGRGRLWAKVLQRRQTPQEGVEVLISNQGRALGMLRLQVKIKRHKT